MKTIRIGNQTSCWAASPMEPFDYAVANRFDAFEWFPDKKPGVGWDETDLSETQRRTIRETARVRDIRLSVHARWQANPLQPDSYPLLETDLRLAQDLGATLLNIHLHHESGLKAYASALLPLIQKTAETGVSLSIENTPLHAPELINELFARLGDQNSAPTGHVGFCLDLGHANLCSATLNDYLAFVDRLHQQVPIIHLHLHENWGDADTHLPLFTGPAGTNDSGIRKFVKRMKARKFSGCIILEQWPRPPSLLNHAKDTMVALFADAEAPGAAAKARPAGLSLAPVRLGR
ncbi:MAG: hypothetical protein C5B50_24290 [Verrucomicrobia bacterium]|nr:MAG: hypothetical protein C5B50_24290 [Verrucomicrobiota bacterium]